MRRSPTVLPLDFSEVLMPHHVLRSLKHEYQVFVDSEIERYKDSVSRHSLLGIADEAVAALRSQAQYEPEELSLCAEVDRLIARRIKLPKYTTWQRKRLKRLAEYRKPETWGIAPDGPLVREIKPGSDTHVLVTGAECERAAIYLAAHGCAVTAINEEEDCVDRVVAAAAAAGLNSRIDACVADLGTWSPKPLTAVVCPSDSLASLTPHDLTRVIESLQDATKAGGVHLFETILNGSSSLTVEELRARYSGWTVAVERESGTARSFLARKAAA